MSVVEELPFGWDDGEFISPYVVTSQEDSEALAHWIWRRVCGQLPVPSSSPRPTAARAHVSLVDLGCGEGTALMNTVAFLNHLATSEPGPCAGGDVAINVAGIDLDETLIQEAQKHVASSTPATTTTSADKAGVSLTTRVRFECGDIRHFNMDDLFPVAPVPSPEAPSSTLCVLFVYLLPEALAQLRESLEAVVKERGWLLVSNRWPVPYLADCLVEAPSHLHIYQFPTHKSVN